MRVSQLRGVQCVSDEYLCGINEIWALEQGPTSNLRWTSTAGKRDLIHSAPDALASTANYLKSYGWRRGEPWSEGPENFNVRLEWNKARVYPKTIAAFAERLAAGSR